MRLPSLCEQFGKERPYLLPIDFQQERQTNDTGYDQLKDIAAGARIQVGVGVGWEEKAEKN
jgi:hypothetical protein